MRVQVVEGDRESLIEIGLPRAGRMKSQLNRQALQRSRDLLGTLRTTVFQPDDLELIKGGPAGRRRYLDDLLVACRLRNDEIRRDLDRVLKQRNALLRQAGPRPDDATVATLDVWDAQLVAVGTELGRRRQALLGELTPRIGAAYAALLDDAADEEVGLEYVSDWWSVGLEAALASVRTDEFRRGVSLAGPHRDDVEITLGGQPARTHGSQGQQRSLALALRMAGHGLVTERTGTAPVVILDDVLSELDPGRARSLLADLPDAQVLLTTAAPLPEGVVSDAVFRVEDGRVEVIDGATDDSDDS